MAGSIWSALGAALQSGGRTFADLSEQERIEQLRKQQMAQEQARFEESRRQFDVRTAADDRDFQSREADKERRIREAAIEGMSPNQIVGDDVVADLQLKAPDLLSRINLAKRVPVGEIGEGMEGIQFQADGTGLEATPHTRKATFQEQATLDKQAQDKADRERVAAFRARISSPEFQKLPFDQQQREVFANTGQQLGLTAEEWERRQGIEHRNRMGQIGAQNAGRVPPASADPGHRWLAGYNQIEDNIRAKYSAQMGALSRAAAENMEGAQEQLEQLYTRIATETEQAATQLLGPRPGSAPQGGGDGTPPPPAGNDPVQKILTDFSQQIQSDPRAFERMLNSSPSVPLEVKRAVIEKVRQMAPVQQSGPPTMNMFDPSGLGTSIAQGLTNAGQAAGTSIMDLIRSLQSGGGAQPQTPHETREEQLRRLAGG